jgi:pSer/pThr/pTyr-binding forkhead associated (FHA) protein
MSDLTFLLVRLGLLALLWLFVLAAVRAIRVDVFGPKVPRAARPQQAAPVREKRPQAKPVKQKAPAARKLVVTEGDLTGTTVDLGAGPVTIGRAPDSTLVLTDDYASSHHARLTPRDGQWVLEDLGSTNGTYLDRTKVASPTAVAPGAKVRIGKTVLELRR